MEELEQVYVVALRDQRNLEIQGSIDDAVEIRGRDQRTEEVPCDRARDGREGLTVQLRQKRGVDRVYPLRQVKPPVGRESCCECGAKVGRRTLAAGADEFQAGASIMWAPVSPTLET